MSTIPLTAAAIADIAQTHYGREIEGLVIDAPPDRLSVDKASPHFDICYRRMGVRLNGVERKGDVQEYDRVAGWVLVRERSIMGKFMLNDDGTYKVQKLTGTVDPYWLPTQRDTGDAQRAIDAAAAKRARRAAKRAGEAL